MLYFLLFSFFLMELSITDQKNVYRKIIHRPVPF
jgi:hypothetical protein